MKNNAKDVRGSWLSDVVRRQLRSCQLTELTRHVLTPLIFPLSRDPIINQIIQLHQLDWLTALQHATLFHTALGRAIVCALLSFVFPGWPVKYFRNALSKRRGLPSERDLEEPVLADVISQPVRAMSTTFERRMERPLSHAPVRQNNDNILSWSLTNLASPLRTQPCQRTHESAATAPTNERTLVPHERLHRRESIVISRLYPLIDHTGLSR
jgi:hypothetical protein